MSPDEIKALAQLLQKVPGIKGIDVEDVRRLVDLLRETPEIGTLELRGWFGTGVVITRTGCGPGSEAAGSATVHYAPGPGQAYPAGQPPPAPAAPAAEPKPAVQLKEIKSPMVGTFYASPEPGAEAYVKVGSRVAPGRTVCIIEAMKIMNEIEAEFGGVIREVCVEDAQPVEFGQVLFRVDPHG
jgi:acetyl-CoA carboxylase biotin carboxyl carrier protein